MRQPRTALVGRDEELARLVDAVGLAGRRGGLVVLSGDAGIGKTRLLHHLTLAAHEAGFAAVVGHCVAQAGSALPYLPFVELVQAVAASAPDAVADVLADHPALAQLLPARAGGVPFAGLGAAGPGLLAEAVHACLTRAAGETGLLAVVEDVHWADHSSRDLLTLLFTRGFAAPVGLVASYRSDDVHRKHPLQETLPVWARLHEVTRIDLDALPEAQMRLLVRGLSPADEDAVARIAHRAGGNPFFAEELVASGPGSLGDDLARVLRTRFEQLDDAAQGVVQAVAIAGRPVGHDLLALVTGLDEDALDRALRLAVDHHTLEVSTSGTYRFRHALVAEAIGEDLLPGRRRRLHQAYAAVLAGHPELAPASELALHAARSGDLPTAIDAGRRAGDSAMAMGGPREALQQYEAVLGWMDEAHPDRDEVTLAAARAASASGDTARAVGLVSERLERPEQTTASDRARLLASWVMHVRLVEEDPKTLPAAEEAVELTDGLQDRARLEALTAQVQALVDAGRHQEAARAGALAVPLAEQLDAQDIGAELRTILSAVVASTLDDAELEARLRSVIDENASGDAARVRAAHWLGVRHLQRGHLRAALSAFDEGAAIAERVGRPWGPFESWCRLRAGLTCYELGDFPGALRRLAMPGPPYPQPAWGAFQAEELTVRAAQRFEVPDALWESVRPYVPTDAVVAALSVAPRMELLARRGDVNGALDALAATVAVVDRQWSSTEQLLFRLTALLLGILADAWPAGDRTQRSRWAEAARHYLGRVALVPLDERPGDESVAWLARLRAEELLLGWASG
ncbi:MAG: ATP-binding protein [Actinomycetes bacterium]